MNLLLEVRFQKRRPKVKALVSIGFRLKFFFVTIVHGTVNFFSGDLLLPLYYPHHPGPPDIFRNVGGRLSTDTPSFGMITCAYPVSTLRSGPYYKQCWACSGRLS